jgi:basic amino acid/polyamine antiporter, APA family
VGVPILFTDKTFVLDFTSIATLFAFVLVCGGVLLLPRKEKERGRFSIPYINGQIIFPLLVVGSMVLISAFSKNYFQDKLDFSFEKKTDKLSLLVSGNNIDTMTAAQQAETYLLANQGNDSVLIKLAETVRTAEKPDEKLSLIKEFTAANDTTQRKTAKVSIIIFWLLMVGLSFFTVIKRFSLIPLLGVSTCLYLLTGMTFLNWLWFGGWLALGLIFYFLYGYKKSRLANK